MKKAILIFLMMILITNIKIEAVHAAGSWDMHRINEGTTHDMYFIGGWAFDNSKYAVIRYTHEPILGQGNVTSEYTYDYGKHHYNKGGVKKSFPFEPYARNFLIQGYEVPTSIPKGSPQNIDAYLVLNCIITTDRELNCAHSAGSDPPTNIDPDPPETVVPHVSSYIPHRDEYRVDYWDFPPNTTSYQVEFLSPNNQYFEKSYNSTPTGTYYLTCNGTYNINFYNGSSLIGGTGNIYTNSLVNPTCDSYAAEEIVNDLNLNATHLGGGNFNFDWQSHPNASIYVIYQNGQKIGETTDQNYNANGYGAYTVRAVDEFGQTVGESDINTTLFYDPSEQGNGGGGGSCDMCQKIANALSCPEWDTYMGEWEDTIRRALPPPPDWESIANTFVNAFDEYFGDMPATPSKNEIINEIEPAQPNVDTSFDEAENLIPDVPDEFDTPFDFDITTGEQIEIIDESEPFEIPDPVDSIEADQPGIYVYPNDSRNHSDGIKHPDSLPITNPYPQVNSDDEIDPVDIPKPTLPMIITP